MTQQKIDAMTNNGEMDLIYDGHITILSIDRVDNETMRVYYRNSFDLGKIVHMITVGKRGWDALKKALGGKIKHYEDIYH